MSETKDEVISSFSDNDEIIEPEATEAEKIIEEEKTQKEEDKEENEITLFDDINRKNRSLTIFDIETDESKLLLSSTEDLGDVIIVEHDITPTEGDTPDGDEIDDIGAESPPEGDDEDTDFGEELALYKKWYNTSIKDQPAVFQMESFMNTISALVDVVGTILTKAIKYSRSAYMYARDEIAFSHVSLKTIHKIYDTKMIKKGLKVNTERLTKGEIEAFSYSLWVDTARLAISSFDMVHRCDVVIFDKNDQTESESMKTLSEQLDKLGIRIDVGSNRLNMDELLDKRSIGTVHELGYDKSQMNNVLRYLGDIAKRIPYDKENPLKEAVDIATKKITTQASMVSRAINSGDLKPDSTAYKNETAKLVLYTARLDYILSTMKLATYLMKVLSKDARRVFRKYEDAMISEKFV